MGTWPSGAGPRRLRKWRRPIERPSSGRLFLRGGWGGEDLWRSRRVAVGPVQGAPWDDLDDGALEEQRKRDARLEELQDDGLLGRPQRQERFPVRMGIAIDHTRIALDRGA